MKPIWVSYIIVVFGICFGSIMSGQYHYAFPATLGAFLVALISAAQS